MNHGARLVAAFETAWADIRRNHPTVPEVVVVAGRAMHDKNHSWAHFAYSAHGPWSTRRRDGDTRPELFVSGEAVSEGGKAVVEALLHEAAHGLAYVRRLQDTSNGHRYHNQLFVALATELGLKAPEKPDEVIGWSDCTLTHETTLRYEKTIAVLDAADLPYANHVVTYAAIQAERDKKVQAHIRLEQQREEMDEVRWQQEMAKLDRELAKLDQDLRVAAPPADTRAGRRLAAVCGCRPARRLQLTPRNLEDGPILCGLCRMRFWPEDGSVPEARQRGRQAAVDRA